MGWTWYTASEATGVCPAMHGHVEDGLVKAPHPGREDGALRTDRDDQIRHTRTPAYPHTTTGAADDLV